MQSRQATGVAREPIGNLCVIRDESLQHWTVLVCAGLHGDRTPLGRFSTRGEAESFARAELSTLNAQQDKRFILHVDDCPCWQKQL